MKVFVRGVVVALFLAHGIAFGAAAKTLINMKGETPEAALAKSWSKVSPGKYKFVLDTAAQLDGGKTMTTAHVKNSLESELGSVLSVKVTPEGANAVVVTFSGDEKKFLKRIAKTKIKAQEGVKIALESGKSEGGIRAKVAARGPATDEVKAKYMGEAKPGAHKVLVLQAGATIPKDIKPGKAVVISSGEAISYPNGHVFFFKVNKVEGEAWVASNITDK